LLQKNEPHIRDQGEHDAALPDLGPGRHGSYSGISYRSQLKGEYLHSAALHGGGLGARSLLRITTPVHFLRPPPLTFSQAIRRNVASPPGTSPRRTE
jgi:hypothetical protein